MQCESSQNAPKLFLAQSHYILQGYTCTATTTAVLQPFVWDHPGEPVPEDFTESQDDEVAVALQSAKKELTRYCQVPQFLFH